MTKKENGGYRPYKLNEKTVKKLEEIFKWWWTITQACLYAWISRDAFYDWMNLKDKFSDKKCKKLIERIELAQEYSNIICRRTIIKEWMDWNRKAAAWWLEKKDSEFKKEKKEAEIKKGNKVFREDFQPFTSLKIVDAVTWEEYDEWEIPQKLDSTE